MNYNKIVNVTVVFTIFTIVVTLAFCGHQSIEQGIATAFFLENNTYGDLACYMMAEVAAFVLSNGITEG